MNGACEPEMRKNVPVHFLVVRIAQPGIFYIGLPTMAF